MDYPSLEKELEIINQRLPDIGQELRQQVVEFVQSLREMSLEKTPGVAETLDWAKCLVALDVIALSPEVVCDTIGAVLKYQDDIAKITGGTAAKILESVRADMAAQAAP